MIVVKSNDVKPVQNPEKDPMVAKGPISLQKLIEGKTSGGFSVSLVKFSPGAKLSYHTHPAEQILYVLEGKGILATKEKKHIVTPGTVIVIPPGEVHMHGATEDSSFTHVAMYQGESKVVE